jgi:hypothetical protein
METAINQMTEAWEDILLEMDSKLKTLAEEKYVSTCDYIFHLKLFSRSLLFRC